MKSAQQTRLTRATTAFPHLLAFCFALLGGMFFSLLLSSDLMSEIIVLGVDPLRAQLLAALLLTACAASVGALVGHRKMSALVGAGFFFSWSYLSGFFQMEIQPVRDPLGNSEPLNNLALVHTVLMMLALALLVAFVGAAVGYVLHKILAEPLLPLALFLRKKIPAIQRTISQRLEERGRKSIVVSWVTLVLFVLLCVLASGSSNLWLYAPDVGLHTAPLLPVKSKEPVNGTLLEESMVSPALGGQRKPFLVYLPPSYNTPQGRLRRYPTLYLLHGSPGTDHDWVTGGKVVQAADTLIALGKMAEAILILPDGNGRSGQTSEWGNSGDGRQNMENFVAVDLVRYVDASYRTIAMSDERGIGGLSMGGFGAMNIALHHPDIFGFVIALGGYYRAEGSIWGKNQAYLRENSPIEVLPADTSAWHLHFYLGAATRDQPYYTDTLQFVQELKSLHLSYQLDIQPGYHAWKVWQVQMYDALPQLHWGS